MRILLVRHGESEGNIDARKYIEKGDSNVSLTEKGWKQAFNAGQFLKGFYSETETSKWPVTYVSSYLRTKQTYRGVTQPLKDIFEGNPKPVEDARLIEKFFGAASNLFHPDEKTPPELVAAILHLSKKVNSVDPFTARHLFGESTKDTLVSIKSFLDGTFDRDCKEGKDDFIFVVHGAVIQAFLIAYAHLQISDKPKLGNPNNCDIIKIEGSSKNWTYRKIYDGEDMQACDLDALKGLKRYSYEDLPQLPDFLTLSPQ